MTLAKVLERAELSRKIGQDKTYVPPEEFLLVVECSGSRLVVQNRSQFGRGYLHEAVYKDYKFVSVSKAPLKFS